MSYNPEKTRIFQTFRNGEIFKMKFSYYIGTNDMYNIGHLAIKKYIEDNEKKSLYHYQKEATKEYYTRYFKNKD